MFPDPGDPRAGAANGLGVLVGATIALFDGDVAAAIGNGPAMVKEEETAGAEEVILGVEVSDLVGSMRVESACEESGTDPDPEAGL